MLSNFGLFVVIVGSLISGGLTGAFIQEKAASMKKRRERKREEEYKLERELESLNLRLTASCRDLEVYRIAANTRMDFYSKRIEALENPRDKSAPPSKGKNK